MAVGSRVIGRVGRLLGRHQVSEEDFMREYRQLEPQGLPGVKKDGKWWRQAITGKVYVPERLRAKVVLNFHYGTSEHPGVLKTRKRVTSMFYWPGLAEDVARVVRECLICARTRTRARLTHNVPKGSLENPSAMGTVSLDHVGPMQLDGQNWWLLVAMDHATLYIRGLIRKTTVLRAVARGNQHNDRGAEETEPGGTNA
ncbi:hypothetical protein GNI_193560 [Gregarina niphandrodes]|uniref:Integrase zinc-binding domain-containing protein n=1 Tax=Gregarina niphandrodes TaxID=110365 RepID=A0A023AWE5_GRENI|nr:hypothetical protein GNI_193560 [Gregarina niphandrodes]EZG43039.1 hypothetical protein GNI_193560 [Gregarina niphandrodes]|eukprot:XP_011133688.1 hypothetical protein GNI_193560 [Gregarina niphandrodes]